MHCQSSLHQDVVEKDVDDDVVAGVDLAAYLLSAADYILGIQRQASLAAPALCVRLLLGDQLIPFPHAKEVFPDLSDHFHRLRAAVHRSPRLLEDVRVNRSLVGDHFFSETGRTGFPNTR